jgi:hypothetical protein
MGTSSPAFSPPGSPVSDYNKDDLNSLLIAQARLGLKVKKKLQTLSNDAKTKYYTYVLLLRDGYIYVGQTDNIYQRMLSHVHIYDSSSQWVKKNAPVERIIEIIKNSRPDDEHYKTLEWMDKVGWQRVRGSYWSSVSLQGPPRDLKDFERENRDFDYVPRKEICEILNVVESLHASHQQHKAHDSI